MRETALIATRRRVSLAVALTATAIGTALALVLWFAPKPDLPEIPSGLAQELNDRSTPIIEEQLTARWFTGAPGPKVACAIRPIATAPESARSVTAVETVYVWANCATLGTEVQSGSFMPIALHLTPPVSIETPMDGADYQEQIERIFPERIQDAILGDVDFGDLDTVLEKRITQIS